MLRRNRLLTEFVVAFEKRPSSWPGFTTDRVTSHNAIYWQQSTTKSTMDAKLTVVKGQAPQSVTKIDKAIKEHATLSSNQEDAAGAASTAASGPEAKTTYISKESMAHLRIR